jgi:hypothetical protein
MRKCLMKEKENILTIRSTEFTYSMRFKTFELFHWSYN